MLKSSVLESSVLNRSVLESSVLDGNWKEPTGLLVIDKDWVDVNHTKVLPVVVNDKEEEEDQVAKEVKMLEIDHGMLVGYTCVKTNPRTN